MGTRTEVVSMKLDVSDLISGYRKAVSDMASAGADGKITSGLTKDLNKLEEQFQRLRARGEIGFGDSKDMIAYTTKVNNLYTELASLGKRMTEISGTKINFPTSAVDQLKQKISQLEDAIAETKQTMSSKLQGLGFSKAYANDLAKSIEKEEDLTAALEQELKVRQQIEVQKKEAAKAAINDINSRLAEQKGKPIKAGDMSNVAIKNYGFTQDDVREVRNAMNQTIANGIAQGKEFGEIWTDVVDSALGEIKVWITDVNALERSIQNLINKRDELQNKSPAVQEYSQAIASREQIGDTSGGTVNFSSSSLSTISAVNEALANQVNLQDQITAARSGMADATRQDQKAQEDLKNSLDGLINSTGNQRDANLDLNQSMIDSKRQAEATETSFNQLRATILSLFSATSVFNMIRRIITQTFQDVQNLDKSFASIAMVTDQTVKGLWSTYGQYADMAAELGQNTDSIIKASALFYQQGLDTNEALELTTDTMKLATLAGNDYSIATQEMTAALRGFKMEMNEGSHVTDVYSELAAHAAATVDDIAQAMSRTASIANAAGMSFENTSAFLTQMIETTQESAENIGTSLKTIIARFTELKENVAGTEDSEFEDLDFNKVDKALKSVGVSLKTTEGQFRNLDEVFLELSQKWNTLDRNTQRYVATIAAGSRQQSRFIAMMDNYERTAELMETAANAEGKADEQFAKYADTIEYKLNQIKTKWEEMRVSFLNSDFFGGLLAQVSTLMDGLKNIDFRTAIALAPIATWAAKQFITIFMNSVKSTTASLSKTGTLIGQTLVDGIMKRMGQTSLFIRANIDTKSFTQTKDNIIREIDTLNSDLAKSNGLDILRNVDSSKMNGMLNAFYELSHAAREAGLGEDEAAAAAKEMLGVFGTSGEKIGKMAAELQNAEARLRDFAKAKNTLQGLELGFKAIGSAAITAFSAIAAGASAKDILKTLTIQLTITAAQFALQEALAQAHEKILTKIKKKGEAERVAATAAGQAATTGAIIAGGVAQAAAGKAAGTAAGAAVTEGFVIGTAGIGAIVVAIGAAITALGFGIAAAVKKYNESKVSIEQQIAETQKSLKDLETASNNAKNTAKESKEAAIHAQELKEEFEELDKKQQKTTDEQERYAELVQEIKETYPEIITYYDEMTGKLKVNADLWKEILQDAKELAKTDATKSLAAAAVVSNTQSTLIDQERQKSYQDFSNNNMKEAGAFLREEYSSYKNYGPLQRAISSTNTLKKEYGEDYFDELAKMAGKDISSDSTMLYLANAMMIYSETAEDEIDALDEDSKEKWQLIDRYQKVVNNQYKEEQAALDRREQLIKEQNAAAYAQDFQEKFDLDEAVATFLGGMEAETGSDVNIARFTGSVNTAYRGYLAEKLNGGVQGTNGASSNRAFTGNDFVAWADINNDTLQSYIEMGAAAMGIEDAASWYEENRKKAAGQEKIYQAYLAGLEAAAIEAMGGDDLDSLTDKEKEAIRTFYETATEMSAEELEKFSDNFSSQREKNEANKMAQEYLQQWEDAVKSNKSSGSVGLLDYIGGTEEDYKKWTAQQAASYKAVLDEIANKTNVETAKTYAKGINDILSGQGFNPEDIADLVSKLDWSNMDLFNEDEFKESTIETIADTFEISKAEAEKVFEELRAIAENSGIVDLFDVSAGKIDEYIEKAKDIGTVFNENADTLAEYMTSNEDSIELNADQYAKLSSIMDSLVEAGVKEASTLIQIDETTGKWVLNNKKLNSILNDNTAELIEQLNKEKEVLTERLNSVDITEEQKMILEACIDSIDSQIDGVKSLNQQVEENIRKWDRVLDKIEKITDMMDSVSDAVDDYFNDGYVSVDSLTGLSGAFANAKSEEFKIENYVNSQLQLNVDGLLRLIEAEIAAAEATGLLTDAERLQYYQWQAMKRQLEDTRKEINTMAEDLQENYSKALKDLADAQQDVIDKQEALNDAIKEYNDLVYGSDNRDSKLDSLYNYTTRLEYLNDEIERSKDLLDNAKTTEESTEALKEYAQAMHSYIATLKAQQEVRKAYANESETKLLNHVETIYDPINGNTIVANYADFVKKNADGTYAIDQLLLEQARFADAFKDELEQAVSDYNDNYKQMRSTDAQIAKLEKEVEERRKNAIKNYAAMERELADALKAEYKKEVDDLKSKYDSMKEADDDYVSALQDAIEKQRKLRERENKWEDLAKKEKKLSLMSRDTSGANRADTMKLEDEIKKDRESLLDEAVDDIIDGLSDLYESQQELRDTEIELKEALLENTLYWNEQAQGLAASFNSVEDYMDWMAQHSTDFAEMTLTQQQEKLNEYGETFTKASEEMAWQAMDAASRTGDTVIDITQTTGDEIVDIVTSTSEVFVHEVEHSMAQVRDAFVNDMNDAIEKINDAKAALQEAINKVNEYAQAVSEAWNALRNAQSSFVPDPSPEPQVEDRLAELAAQRRANEGNSGAQSAIDQEASRVLGSTAYWTGYEYSGNIRDSLYTRNQIMDNFSEEKAQQILEGNYPVHIYSGNPNDLQLDKIRILKGFGYGVAKIGNKIYVYDSYDDAYDEVQANAASLHGNVHIYKSGGFVDYTGPAWVDGTPERPEAFLSAEDTERIGQAANILASLPFLNPSGNISNTSNTYGDTAIEININIESVSSPEDIDNMMNRLKEEIVTVARPVGTNVILQQGF